MIKDHLGSRTVGASGVMLQIHHIELIITTFERKSVTAGLLRTMSFAERYLFRFRGLVLSQGFIHTSYIVATAMSRSERLSLAGLGTAGSSISNLDIFDMVAL